MKTTRARYTIEFKQEAVRRVERGQSIVAADRTLADLGAVPGLGSQRGGLPRPLGSKGSGNSRGRAEQMFERPRVADAHQGDSRRDA